jgi:thiol-disulfide isomerase/thioredoxin
MLSRTLFILVFLQPWLLSSQSIDDSLKDILGNSYPAVTWQKLVRQGAFTVGRQSSDSNSLLIGKPVIDTAKAPWAYPKPPRGRYFKIGQPLAERPRAGTRNTSDLISEFTGKIVVINYWFVNCQPCRKEIPDLNRLAAMYRDTSIVFVAITHNNATDVDRYLAQQPFIYRQITEVVDHRVQSFPVNLILDRYGNIAWSSNGFHAGTTAWMAYEIAQLLRR